MDQAQNGLALAKWIRGGEMDQEQENGSAAEDKVAAEKVEMDQVEVAAPRLASGLKKKQHGGHNVHRPNDTTKRQVGGMALAGLDHDRISRMIGISADTLRKHYRTELEQEGLILGEIAQNLAQRAMDGDTISSIFYLKARAGWRDQHVKIDQSVQVVDTAKHRLLDMLGTAKPIIEHTPQK